MLCVLCFISNLLVFFYFTGASVKCRVAAVKRHPILHHSADYILLSLGLLSPFWLIWKSNTTSVGARGGGVGGWGGGVGVGVCMQPCKLHFCTWRDLIKPSLRFLTYCVFLVSIGNLLNFYCSDFRTIVDGIFRVNDYKTGNGTSKYRINILAITISYCHTPSSSCSSCSTSCTISSKFLWLFARPVIVHVQADFTFI